MIFMKFNLYKKQHFNIVYQQNLTVSTLFLTPNHICDMWQFQSLYDSI